MPVVSVVIPSFNRGHCIKPCIESVLAQSYRDLEVIVIDDGSVDDTRDQVSSVSDARIRYIAHNQNRGGAAARNTGIRKSQSEFIAFLDSDDRWTPDKLEKQLQLLRMNGEEYGFVYSWSIAKNPAGEEVWRMNKTIDGLAVVDLILANFIGTFSSVVVRRSVLDAVNGLDERMRSCQDWDLFVRINAITKVCCVREYLVLYLENRNDKYRISSNPASIILGHRRMLQKMEGRFSDISADAKVSSLKTFANVFVLAGAASDVLRTGIRVIRIAPTFENIRFLTWNLARVLKRILTKNLGF
jgi:glycosyltransferase involved in cell wall biosynthesis